MAQSINKTLPYEDIKIGPGKFKRPKFFGSQREINFFKILKRISRKPGNLLLFLPVKRLITGARILL